MRWRVWKPYHSTYQVDARNDDLGRGSYAKVMRDRVSYTCGTPTDKHRLSYMQQLGPQGRDSGIRSDVRDLTDCQPQAVTIRTKRLATVNLEEAILELNRFTTARRKCPGLPAGLALTVTSEMGADRGLEHLIYNLSVLYVKLGLQQSLPLRYPNSSQRAAGSTIWTEQTWRKTTRHQTGWTVQD